MGKLAERYEDAARSGVYRVTHAEIPVRAAREAKARLIEYGTGALQSLSALRETISEGDTPCVVLVDAKHFEHREGLAELAAQCRADALPFFAIFVDPAAALDLPDLYKER